MVCKYYALVEYKVTQQTCLELFADSKEQAETIALAMFEEERTRKGGAIRSEPIVRVITEGEKYAYEKTRNPIRLVE